MLHVLMGVSHSTSQVDQLIEEAVIFMLIATHVSANSQVRAATARRAPHVRCLLSLFSNRKRSHSSPLRLLDVVVVSFALGSLTIMTWHREE